jgi:hypothetical protein
MIIILTTTWDRMNFLSSRFRPAGNILHAPALTKLCKRFLLNTKRKAVRRISVLLLRYSLVRTWVPFTERVLEIFIETSDISLEGGLNRWKDYTNKGWHRETRANIKSLSDTQVRDVVLEISKTLCTSDRADTRIGKSVRLRLCQMSHLRIILVMWVSEWVSERVSERASEWASEQAISWLSEWWISERLDDWAIGWMSERLDDWASGWMSERLDDLASGWMSERLDDWASGWMSERLDDWASGWMTERLDDWASGWMSDWAIEWLRKWLDGWTSEWLTGRLTDRSSVNGERMINIRSLFTKVVDHDLVRRC